MYGRFRPRFAMTRVALTCFAVVGGTCFATALQADPVVLSGEWDPEGPLAPVAEVAQNPGCLSSNPRPYEIIGPLTVNMAGTYRFADMGNSFYGFTETGAQPGPSEGSVSIFEGMPDLNNFDENRVTSIVTLGEVDLEPGTEYYLLAQPSCDIGEPRSPVWGHHVDGPGLLSGDGVLTPPDYWSGDWSESDPLHPSVIDPEGCPITYTDITGPHRFERTGYHFLSNLGQQNAGSPDLIAVYEGGYDPDAPEENLVGVNWETFFPIPRGILYLEAGTDYFFTVQPLCDLTTGPWFFTIFPPAPFQLNSLLSSTYYNPTTSGQGVLMDVDGDTNFVFAAWFTWAGSDTPSASGIQAVGDAQQRWFTLSGNFEKGSGTVDLDITSSSGGLFNDPSPVSNETVGTARLEMENCESGRLEYLFDTGENGTTSMERLLNGNLDACEAFLRKPAAIGN